MQMTAYFLQIWVPILLGAATSEIPPVNWAVPILVCLITGNAPVFYCQWFSCKLLFGDCSGSWEPCLFLHSWASWQGGLMVRAAWGTLSPGLILELTTSLALSFCKKKGWQHIPGCPVSGWCKVQAREGCVGCTARHFVFAGLEREVRHCPQLSGFNPPDSHLPMGSCSGVPSPREEELEGLGQFQAGVCCTGVIWEEGWLCRGGSWEVHKVRCGWGTWRGMWRMQGRRQGCCEGRGECAGWCVCVCEVPAGGAGAILLAHDWQRGNLPSRLVLSLRPPLN